MAYDVQLTADMRDALACVLGPSLPGIEEKRMMGGVCFMLHGNMVGGADRSKEGERRFMFRLGKGNAPGADLPGGEPVVFGGRAMSGLYFVDADRCEADLMARWLAAALEHAAGLPPK